MNLTFYTIVHWLHLTAAATALGGTIFLRIVVHPTLEKLGDEVKGKFMEAAGRKIMMVIMHSFGLLIVTGILNMIRVFQPGADLTQTYLLLFVAKVILALALVTMVMLLLLPSEALKEFQAKSSRYFALSMVLGLVILYLSGWIRLEGQYHKAPQEIFDEPDEEEVVADPEEGEREFEVLIDSIDI